MVQAKEISKLCFPWESVKHMVPAMVASVEAMLEKWGYHNQGKEIEMSKEFKLLTSELPMIVNETLRLYSPVVSLSRRACRKNKLGKYEIPANVDVSVPILALHRNQELWGKDAHLFNPERFAEGLAKATNGNVTAFLPFGGGARACVGLNFAINEAKITLAMILQRYRLKLSPNYVHSPCQFLTINPQHGSLIILQSYNENRSNSKFCNE